MPSAYTSNLRLTLPAQGELTNSWGTTVNTGITTLIDTAIAGTTSITVGGTDYTLSTNNGSTDESRAMFIVASGTPGAARNVICPAVSKLYFFRNDTTGGFALTLKTSSGSGIAVPAGQYRILYCNGTNVVEAFNSLAALTLGTALTVASGGTGAATFTANNVLLGNGTSAFQTVAPGTANNVLYSDGTTWVAGPLPSSSAVSSFSASTTGLTPSTPTTGNIVLGGTLSVANGGTGQTTYTDGQLLIGNTTGNTLTKATLTAGTGITITNGSGSITITAAAASIPDYVIQSYGIV